MRKRTSRYCGWGPGGHARLSAILHNDPASCCVYEAARDRRCADVVALLEQGVDPDACCPEKGYTALIAAVSQQRTGGDIEDSLKVSKGF